MHLVIVHIGLPHSAIDAARAKLLAPAINCQGNEGPAHLSCERDLGKRPGSATNRNQTLGVGDDQIPR